MKRFVIGIGGVTNGGKTTLAKSLQKHLPNCSVISQDDFFKPESEIDIDENGFLQYDVLEALNMEKNDVSSFLLDGKPRKLCGTSSLGKCSRGSHFNY